MFQSAAEVIYNTMNKSSFGMSNMIGPLEQVTLANHPVKGIYFMVCGTPKVSITKGSYNSIFHDISKSVKIGKLPTTYYFS